MPCPWYIELAHTNSCPSEEAALKVSCKQQVLVEANSGAGVEADIDIPDDGLTERERSRAAAKLAKLQAKEKEKEDKKLTRSRNGRNAKRRLKSANSWA